ncbi:hypothetical protein K502DRAFT_367118 [Neoconidiobolus thromboides FSU 785]|nr:hypothetical protein K502DRAFT_367118 [Neoconidiobolus thromboides FSU 785]
MGLKEELFSLKIVIYAQWLSILASFFLLLIPIFYISPMEGLLSYSVSCWFFAIIILILEIPIFIEYIPKGNNHNKLVIIYQNHYLRASLFFCFSLILFLSCIIFPSPIITGAIPLTISSILYVVAGYLGHNRDITLLLGGDTSKINQV